jgi:tetratricopeptide (TPR) repeat protein
MELTQALTQVRQYKNKGRYTEAARHCLAILKRDPANIEANLLYGQLAIDMRRPEDAIIIFIKLLAMAPDNAVAHDSLAYLYNETNDYANAKRHALAAIRLNPMLLESQLVLGAIEVLEGDKARGLRMFDNARQRAPGQLRVEMAYAQALL